MHLSEQERKEIKIETILGLVDETGTEFSARAALISCLNWMDSHEISQMLRTTNLRTGEIKGVNRRDEEDPEENLDPLLSTPECCFNDEYPY